MNVKVHTPLPAGASDETGGEAMKPRKDSADKGAGSGCMARLVRLFISSSLEDRLLMVAIAVWGVAFVVKLAVLIMILYKALGGPL